MSAKSGLSIVCLQLGPRIHRVVGCPLFRGCLSIEVNGRTVGTFRIVRYIMGVCSEFHCRSRAKGACVRQCTL